MEGSDAEAVLTLSDVESLRRTMSNTDLKRLIEMASTEFERRKHQSLDLDIESGALLPSVRTLVNSSLRTFGNNFLMAFNMRAGVAVVLHLLRVLQRNPRSVRTFTTLIGEDALRYRVDAVQLGLFAGTLTGGTRLLQGLLHRYRRKNDGANIFLGGCVASLAFAFIGKDRRRTLALYTFARVAQAVYNSWKSRGWFHFWGSHWEHGDATLFLVSNAYVMRPEALPRSYWNFIVKTGPIPKAILEQVRRNNRSRPLDLAAVTTLLAKHGRDTSAVASKFAGVLPVVPCSIVHPHTDYCSMQIYQTFKSAFARSLPMYFSLAIVPAIVLKFSRFLNNPGRVFSKALLSTVRSSAFLAAFPTLYMSVICGHRKLGLPDHRVLYFLAGFAGASSIWIEQKSRRAELALYVMPRAADALFFILRDRRWLVGVPYGEELLFAVSMGGLLYFHHHERATVSPLFAKILDVFLPPPAKQVLHERVLARTPPAKSVVEAEGGALPSSSLAVEVGKGAAGDEQPKGAQ